MHALQRGLVEGVPNTGKVNRLTTGHTQSASGNRQALYPTQTPAGRNIGIAAQKTIKRLRLQGVTRQQSLRLAKLHMDGGLSAAQHIVIHAGHVIVNQRVSVNKLNRAARAQGRFTNHGAQRFEGLAVNRLTGSNRQQGPQAFTATRDAVLHRFTQGLWGTHRQPLVERQVNLINATGRPSCEVKGLSRTHASRSHALA